MAFTGSFDRSPYLGDLKTAVATSTLKSHFTASYFAPVAETPAASTSGQAIPIYRGIVGGTFVYSVGSPPGGGAVFITIIGYTE